MIKIVHLPHGKWCIERADGQARSESFDYSSVGYWIHGPYLFVGQTEYYGVETVLMAMNPATIDHDSIDRTV